jgi:hypothetical protein
MRTGIAGAAVVLAVRQRSVSCGRLSILALFFIILLLLSYRFPRLYPLLVNVRHAI